MNKNFHKKWSGKGPVFWLTGLAALVSTGCILILFLGLVHESVPVFKSEGMGFLSGEDWFAGEAYGALPMIFGSLTVTGLAVFLVLPFALGAAVLTSEFLSARMRLSVKAAMELLAGVPGIIYGLMGIALLTGWVRDVFGLIDGNTLLTAGLLLAVMILPTVMTLSEDALRTVPGAYRDTALSLGLTRIETVFKVVIPQALPGLAGAVFLGLGRAMGETIAVMLVIGGIDRIPQPWFNLFAPGQNIPSKIGREAAEALGFDLQWSALIALGLVLFVMVISITLAGNLLLRRVR
ncbi:MAG: phosphate ABC transporter permease subunit PstC [Nitrospinaceae bacterium]|nr:phosphate ABC transporter permease subunit PstC [Nitrospinaceae bacterium]NIR55648.1 phosphate ABC transporter permease subunit PstC [Nitrospinaceae bacterium]NIS86090.1 phosphate ABC transporter permease subunit PstC [Nitrospinaceae bacterium]NIT82934.1 phosphate ABC transporter permease subunit PstC [Nitrospinaceae bacterium]NIU45137.1 phosphate ABC transporter permease subunit PstC [Nitrospinaceae bacterium]